MRFALLLFVWWDRMKSMTSSRLWHQHNRLDANALVRISEPHQSIHPCIPASPTGCGTPLWQQINAAKRLAQPTPRLKGKEQGDNILAWVETRELIITDIVLVPPPQATALNCHSLAYDLFGSIASR